MKTLSYFLATLAVIGFGMLPANAVEKDINNNTIITDATEQIKQSTEPEACCLPIYNCC
ncbi:MAG: hypothetical protein QNJ55_07345 [Xenococcus sp. MO_188.B8]|nr:hypothetical protein [Xenococcus sp. MO_188.B8]